MRDPGRRKGRLELAAEGEGKDTTVIVKDLQIGLISRVVVVSRHRQPIGEAPANGGGDKHDTVASRRRSGGRERIRIVVIQTVIVKRKGRSYGPEFRQTHSDRQTMGLIRPIGVRLHAWYRARRTPAACTVRIEGIPHSDMASSVGKIDVLRDASQPIGSITERIPDEAVILKILILVPDLNLGK